MRRNHVRCNAETVTTTAQNHWDEVYGRSSVTDVSWFQNDPAISVALLAEAGAGPHEPIVDVGGGASILVDRLLELGHADVTVLDVAAGALAAAKARLGTRADHATWIVSDLLAWQPTRHYRVWHDRAVFHFLTDAADRDRYRHLTRRALLPRGHLIIGTFAADGPTHCSGLPTARYDPDALAAEFPDYEVVRARRQEHETPAGRIQPFTWLLLRVNER